MGMCTTGRHRTIAAIFLSRGKQTKNGRNKRFGDKCIWNLDQAMPEGLPLMDILVAVS